MDQTVGQSPRSAHCRRCGRMAGNEQQDRCDDPYDKNSQQHYWCFKNTVSP